MLRFLQYILIGLIYLNVVTVHSFAEEENSLKLTVEEAVDIARKNNSSIDLSRADVSVARSRVRKAKASYYPQINTKAVVPFIGTESGIFVDQLIWDFGRTSNTVKARELEIEESKFDYMKNIEDVVTETRISYYRTIIAMNRSEALKKVVRKNDLLLEKTQQLVQSGRSSNLALTEVSSDLAESRLTLTNAINTAENRKLDLFNNMGIEPNENFKLVENLEVDKIKYTLDESIQMAFRNSKTLKSLEAELSGIEARLDARKSEFLPEIFGRVAYRIEGEGTDEEGTDTPAFIAGVGMKFPIFLGFSRFADLDETNAQYTRSKTSIKRAKELLSSDVKMIYSDINYAMERIDVTKSSLQVADNNLDLIKEKYQMGRASSLDVVDAEAFKAQTLADYKEALYLYKITKARYDRIIGEIEIK